MEKNAKIYVAGHLGLVGSAIVRNLKSKGYNNLVFRSFKELDLTDRVATLQFFEEEKPEYVILAAAKVGGIVANNTYRAEFILDNLQIQNNVVSSAHKAGVKKLLFLGSSCIYPKNSPQPMSEDVLLTDILEYTNEPYAIAKIAGIKLCESFNIQYGTDFISVMPTNLYGPNDNYDLEKSHVLPALIRKMHLGKALVEQNWDSIINDMNKLPIEGVTGNASKEDIIAKLNKYGISENDGKVKITLWGTGTPRREFLHSNDMADACVHVLENVTFDDLAKGKTEIRNTHINIGSGVDLSIKDLSELVKKVVGYTGEIVWDETKPDGTFQKLQNVEKLNSLGWKYSIKLEDGIRSVYEEYKK